MAIDRTTYNLPYIRRRESWRDAYTVMANVFATAFGTGSIIDIGCAGGLLVEALRERGFEAWGLDGAPASETLWPTHMRHRYILSDLETPAIIETPATDFVCSLEVAEHLAATTAAAYVALLIRHHPKRVFFTAAPIGQPGVGHVNCRPFSYWIGLFNAHGYEADVRGMCFVRHCLRDVFSPDGRNVVPEHYVSNFLTFQPREAMESPRVKDDMGKELLRAELAAQNNLLKYYTQKIACVNEMTALLCQGLGEPTELSEPEVGRLLGLG